MMKDYFRKRPDLGLSLALHAFLFFALLFFVLLRSCSNKTPVHVFELTELSETLHTSRTPPAQTKRSVPQVQSQSQTESVPVKRMQLEDFLKKHPRNPNRPKSQAEPKTSPQNRIEQFDALPKFKNEVIQSEQNQQMTEMERSALQAYGLSIYQKIRSQWYQPNINAEKDLSVEVAFTVLANGMIADVQLIHPSNNTAFNHSILTVFKRLVRFQPTPSQKNEQFQMVFKLN